MLRETKIGLLVGSSFLGLLGTVLFLKYQGDPLAAAMEPSGMADHSFLDEPRALPEAHSPASEPVPVATSPTAQDPVPAKKDGPGLENIGSGHGLQLVSTNPQAKEGPASHSHNPSPQVAEHRTVPPQNPETAPAPSPTPAPTNEPGELVGPPPPDPMGESPPAGEKHPKHEPGTAVAAADPQPPDNSLNMPAPDAVLGHSGAATENKTPGGPAIGTTTPTPENPPTKPPTQPLATLGTPAQGTPGTGGGNPHASSPTPTIPKMDNVPSNQTPTQTIPATATPGAAIGPLASAGGPTAGGAPGAIPSSQPGGGSLAGAPTAMANPPVTTPAPAVPVPVVTKVVSFDEETHVCKPGDTFQKVAQQYYHSDRYDQALATYNRSHPQANPAFDPTNLAAGQAVYIPQAKVLENRYPNLIQGLTPLPAAPAAAAPNQRYQVRSPAGEMMRDIASRSLGNPDRWMDIYRINPTLNPAQPIPVGTTLLMPPDAKP